MAKWHFIQIVLGVTIITSACTRNSAVREPAAEPSASPSPVVQKGNRTLGIDILNTDSSGSFDNNVSIAKSVGAEAMILPISWNLSEPTTANDCATAGSYSDYGGVLSTFNTVLAQGKLKLSLTIPVIHTTLLLVPANLAATAFNGDDAKTDLLTCRFTKYLDWVKSRIPDISLASIQIGNELSLYSASGSPSTAYNFWSSYWRFYVNAAAHARSLWPGIPIGVTDDLYGLSGTGGNAYSKDGMKALNNVSDFISMTYYPKAAGGTVKDPGIIFTELPPLLAEYPSKPFHIQEIGYQSGSQFNGSSEAKQEEFVLQTIRFWDQYAERIPFLSFLRLNDLSHSSAVDLAATYGTSAPGFIEYLETLGLRRYDGTEKAAFTRLKQELKARGW